MLPAHASLQGATLYRKEKNLLLDTKENYSHKISITSTIDTPPTLDYILIAPGRQSGILV